MRWSPPSLYSTPHARLPATGAHDNIVGLRGLCSHGSDLYLIMELCPRWVGGWVGWPSACLVLRLALG